ncbi:hypothetical protein SVIOM342S_04740 [Streptomyces violaceorubidus]
MSDTASLRDLLLARLPGSGLSAEEQALLRDLLPTAQPRSGRRSGTVYMRSITASGWRGIGPAATVRLNPGPGLTLVVGRNGSGKSSFAEAAEMALTGDNFRWQGRTQVWKKGWRNLHEHSSPEIAVELDFDAGSDGEGAKEPVTVRRIWHGEGLEESNTLVEETGQPTGKAVHDVIDAEQLSLYRPFLPYTQLGAVINGPLTTLHDEISRILGLELLSDTDAAARARAKSLTDTESAAKALTATVVQELSEVDDPRAKKAITALSGRSPDLDAVRTLLQGHGAADEAHLARLRRLADLELPDRPLIAKAVTRLRSAAAVADDARHGSAEDARQLVKLLDAALEHRRRHPDASDCPVCGSTNLLDRSWAERTRAQVERLQGEAAEAEAAHRELVDAVREVHDLMRPAPAWLQADEPSLATLWRDLIACRTVRDPCELADRAERAEAVLGDACDQVCEDARRRVTAQDGRWQPVATRLSAWLVQTEAAQAAKPARKQVKAVRDWVRALTDELRDARFKPFADQSGQDSLAIVVRAQQRLAGRDRAHWCRSAACRVSLPRLRGRCRRARIRRHEPGRTALTRPLPVHPARHPPGQPLRFSGQRHRVMSKRLITENPRLAARILNQLPQGLATRLPLPDALDSVPLMRTRARDGVGGSEQERLRDENDALHEILEEAAREQRVRADEIRDLKRELRRAENNEAQVVVDYDEQYKELHRAKAQIRELQRELLRLGAAEQAYATVEPSLDTPTSFAEILDRIGDMRRVHFSGRRKYALELDDRPTARPGSGWPGTHCWPSRTSRKPSRAARRTATSSSGVRTHQRERTSSRPARSSETNRSP